MASVPSPPVLRTSYCTKHSWAQHTPHRNGLFCFVLIFASFLGAARHALVSLSPHGEEQRTTDCDRLLPV